MGAWMRVAVSATVGMFLLACGGAGDATMSADATGVPVGGAPAATAGAPAKTPPKVVRTLDALTYRGTFSKGDFLVALDYTNEGWGKYGFLYDDGGLIWVVEGDTVVGGPFVDGGPEINQVIANWTAFEKNRHAQVMQGVAAMPHGCLEGCAFEVYDASGGFRGYRIEY